MEATPAVRYNIMLSFLWGSAKDPHFAEAELSSGALLVGPAVSLASNRMLSIH